jgi:hypothetical protein
VDDAQFSLSREKVVDFTRQMDATFGFVCPSCEMELGLSFVVPRPAQKMEIFPSTANPDIIVSVKPGGGWGS